MRWLARVGASLGVGMSGEMKWDQRREREREKERKKKGMEMKIMGFPGDEIWVDIFGNCMSVPKAQICKIDMLGKSK
jgi:hypothetical protein